jgi:hypothetical protein
MKTSVNYVGNSSMVAKGLQGRSLGVPGLIIENSDGLGRFMRSIRHINIRNQGKVEFNRQNFEAGDFEEILKDHKVKLELKA